MTPQVIGAIGDRHPPHIEGCLDVRVDGTLEHSRLPCEVEQGSSRDRNRLQCAGAEGVATRNVWGCRCPSSLACQVMRGRCSIRSAGSSVDLRSGRA